jgi:hypothetical protein
MRVPIGCGDAGTRDHNQDSMRRAPRPARLIKMTFRRFD